jgi:hypothetical protein
MAFAEHGLAPKRYELGKLVLVLAALGIFAKVLRIDLSQLDVLGIKFGASSTSLIPGLIGVALVYALAAFFVASTEAAFTHLVDSESKALAQLTMESKSVRWLSVLALAISGVVYATPWLLGAFASWYLWRDVVTLVKLVWVERNGRRSRLCVAGGARSVADIPPQAIARVPMFVGETPVQKDPGGSQGAILK